jgi:hypothetical protein
MSVNGISSSLLPYLSTGLLANLAAENTTGQSSTQENTLLSQLTNNTSSNSGGSGDPLLDALDGTSSSTSTGDPLLDALEGNTSTTDNSGNNSLLTLLGYTSQGTTSNTIPLAGNSTFSVSG